MTPIKFPRIEIIIDNHTYIKGFITNMISESDYSYVYEIMGDDDSTYTIKSEKPILS